MGLSFQLIHNSKLYARDKKEIYYAFYDIACYECIGYYHSVDRWIPNADPKTFEVLYKNWAKDKNNVYYAGEVVKWVDINSLEISKDWLSAKDKNYIYKVIINEKKRKFDVLKNIINP